jgi:hypothetical protein
MTFTKKTWATGDMITATYLNDMENTIDAHETKLAGIATSATAVASSSTNGNIKINGTETVVYTHPTTAGNIHLPAAGATGQYVKWSAAGTGTWSTPNFTEFGGTLTDVQHGSRGGGTLHSAVTTSANGFMIAADKAKLDILISVKNYGAVGDGTTSDQTAIASAVADAYTNGYGLDWGRKGLTYLITDTIPNFHQVKHFGNAIVKRGTSLFYVEPNSSQTNTIYVGVTGSSNTFDGLTSDKPVAKLQQAFDWIANYGPVLRGNWQINMTAGTFIRAVLKDGLMMENALVINGYNVGAYPAVPTTIISEGAGTSAVGIAISGGSKVIVNNIKATGYNGTTSSAGLKATDAAELTTSNVHTDSCYWGISGENRAEIIVPDGIHNNDGYLSVGNTGGGAAIRSLQLTRHAIGLQNNGNQTNTAQFTNCYQAMFAQESSTGHMDWCTVTGCGTGIAARVSARVNCDGTVFKRNTTDITADSNAHVYISSAVVFSTSTDESTNKVITSNGGTVTNNTLITGKEIAYSTIERMIDRQFLNQTVATTTNTTVYTAIFKAPLWRNTPSSTALMRKVTVRVTGTMNGANNNKRINMRFGSALAAVTYASTDNGTFVAEGEIHFTGPDAQYLFLTSYRHLGSSPKQSRTIGANVMTADVSLTIEGQVDSASDNIVFDIVEIGISG